MPATLIRRLWLHARHKARLRASTLPARPRLAATESHVSMKFSDLALAPPIFKVLEQQGYTAPTPIQGQAIPPILEGRDIMGIAQTGTGKTAAFALPILTRLAADKSPVQRRTCRALILSPTRELAAQIADSFETYGKGLGLSVATVYGGVAHGPQRNALMRGVDIVVATPGRLLDHVGERNLDLSGTGILVLDEADQMLDLGFVVPIRRVVAQLPARRQTLFFSATMPREIATLASEILRDPIKISVTPTATTAERVDQEIIYVETAKKRSLLAVLLADPAMARTIVFTRTKRGADKVSSYLVECGMEAAAIHGNKSQRQREQTLDLFKAGKLRILVATDIAARGIDVDSVSHVVNFELPEVPEAYVHRIGRTARAGAGGRAISLVDNDERDLLRSIEKLTRQQITSQDRRNDNTLVAAAKVTSAAGSRDESRGRSGGRDARGGRPSGDRSFGDRSFGDRPSRPSGDRPQGERKFSDRGDRPARAAGPGRPAGDRPDRPQGERTFSDRPRSDFRDRPDRGDRPSRPPGDRPDRPQGERKFSDRPRSDFRDRPDRGDRPSRPPGDRPSRPPGDRPDRPQGERTFSDRPRSDFRDRPDRGDRPSRPPGDRPSRPAGDRPARPQGERTFSDRPRSDFRERPDRGDRPSRPAGDRPSRPAGDRPSRPAGDRPSRPPGDRPAGKFSERPRGGKPGGDRSARPAGSAGKSFGSDRPKRRQVVD